MLNELKALREERDSLQIQRDQVLHLLAGGTLTEEEVKASGLGIGVLSEQRHHEFMRTKAEKALEQAETSCRELKRAINCKILGKSAYAYLLSQFPALVGHVPVRNYFLGLGCAMACPEGAEPDGLEVGTGRVVEAHRKLRQNEYGQNAGK